MVCQCAGITHCLSHKRSYQSSFVLFIVIEAILAASKQVEGRASKTMEALFAALTRDSP